MSEQLNDDLDLVMSVLADVLGESKFSMIDRNDVIKELSEMEGDDSNEFDYTGSYHPYKRINKVVGHFVTKHKKRKLNVGNDLDFEKSKSPDGELEDNETINAEVINEDSEEQKTKLLASLITVYPDVDPKLLQQICARLNYDVTQIQDWIETNIDKIPEKRQVQAINRFALESTCRSHEQIWKCPICEMWQIIGNKVQVAKCSEVVSCGEFCIKCNKKVHAPFKCRQKCQRIDNMENEMNIFKKLRTPPDEDKGYAKMFIIRPQNNLNFSDPLHILYLAAEGTFLRMIEMSNQARSGSQLTLQSWMSQMTSTLAPIPSTHVSSSNANYNYNQNTMTTVNGSAQTNGMHSTNDIQTIGGMSSAFDLPLVNGSASATGVSPTNRTSTTTGMVSTNVTFSTSEIPPSNRMSSSSAIASERETTTNEIDSANVMTPPDRMSTPNAMLPTDRMGSTHGNGSSNGNGSINGMSSVHGMTSANGMASTSSLNINSLPQLNTNIIPSVGTYSIGIPALSVSSADIVSASPSTTQTSNEAQTIGMPRPQLSVLPATPSTTPATSVGQQISTLRTQLSSLVSSRASGRPRRNRPSTSMCRNSIKAIKYIENESLRGRFISCKSYFLSRGIPHGERLVFHGTSANLDSIIKDNLKLSHCKRFAFGKGIYFSEFPSTSQLYGKHLLLCRVMLGNPYEGNEHIIPPNFQSKIVHPNEEGKANMIIIDKEDQILPAFIIELQDLEPPITIS